jgi:hypothetical protein
MTLGYQESKDRNRKTSQRLMQRLYRERRDTAVETYGAACRVCGNRDRPDLQIVPRKGYRWTQAAGLLKTVKGGHEKMRWLDQNGFPDSFTLVCGPTFSQCRKALQLLD